jgi:hypothetical protein
MHELLARHHELRISTGRISSTCNEIRTQVLPATGAPFAASAGRVNPRNTYSFSLQFEAAARAFPDHGAHDLVSRRHGQYGRSRAPFNLVQFGVANAAGVNLNQHLRMSWRRRSDYIQLERA